MLADVCRVVKYESGTVRFLCFLSDSCVWLDAEIGVHKLGDKHPDSTFPDCLPKPLLHLSASSSACKLHGLPSVTSRA